MQYRFPICLKKIKYKWNKLHPKIRITIKSSLRNICPSIKGVKKCSRNVLYMFEHPFTNLC